MACSVLVGSLGTVLSRYGTPGPRTSVGAFGFTLPSKRMHSRPAIPGPSVAHSHCASGAHVHTVGHQCLAGPFSRADWAPGWQDTSGYHEHATQEGQAGCQGQGAAEARGTPIPEANPQSTANELEQASDDGSASSDESERLPTVAEIWAQIEHREAEMDAARAAEDAAKAERQALKRQREDEERAELLQADLREVQAERARICAEHVRLSARGLKRRAQERGRMRPRGAPAVPSRSYFDLVSA